MTIQCKRSATLNGALLCCDKVSLGSHKRGWTNLLVSFLYYVDAIEQVLETSPPGTKPTTAPNCWDRIELMKRVKI